MNYIEEITAFFKHHNRESEIPFALLSAKMQGIEQGRVDIDRIPYTNIDMLLCWGDTKEGTFFWAMIYNFNHPEYIRWPDYKNSDGLTFQQYMDKWEMGGI